MMDGAICTTDELAAHAPAAAGAGWCCDFCFLAWQSNSPLSSPWPLHTQRAARACLLPINKCHSGPPVRLHPLRVDLVNPARPGKAPPPFTNPYEYPISPSSLIGRQVSASCLSSQSQNQSLGRVSLLVPRSQRAIVTSSPPDTTTVAGLAVVEGPHRHPRRARASLSLCPVPPPLLVVTAIDSKKGAGEQASRAQLRPR